jgi:hypothetical protein
MNKIFHYRLDGTHNESLSDDPWSQCMFNSNTDLSQFAAHPLVTIGKQPIIKLHQATYLTGRDTCHAHHFAKMVAGSLLSGNYTQAPSLKVNTIESSSKSSLSSKSTIPTILWIDTLHGPHACAEFYQEMKDTFHFEEGQFHLMCLDILGVFREDFCYLIGEVENHIHRLRPTLVVIDDIDHFMPYCGITAASHFDHIFRDALNHTETAFLLIGYNHLGKRASTTGNLGKLLFTGSNSIFSISTQGGISHVRLVRAFENRWSIPEAEFLFSLGEDNLPHEIVKTVPSGTVSPTRVEYNTLQDIIREVIEPGETLTPDQLLTRVSTRKTQLNRIDRARTLITQALNLGLIKKDIATNSYTLTPSNLDNAVNTHLTLPPHPSTIIPSETTASSPSSSSAGCVSM